MDKSALQKYTGRLEPVGCDPPEGDPARVEDLGSFGWLRGFEARALMLDLRKRSGNRLAITYSWVSEISFDPSVGIIVLAGGRKITIAGRNLHSEPRPGIQLYEGFLRQRVPWICESTIEWRAEASGCVVESITW